MMMPKRFRKTMSRISDMSNGAFDVTIAPVSTMWDFTSGAAVVPDAGAIAEAAGRVDYSRVELDGNRVTLPEGMMIDLGGIAKGYIADAVKGYYPVSGQTATHYTIRKERGIDQRLPIVDEFAPLNKARKLETELVLITGDRKLEMMARYEENLYLKSILEGVGNKEITIHEMSGFDHGSVLVPACDLIKKYMKGSGK